MAKLIQTHEGINLREFPLAKPITTLGRRSDNDIQIEDAAVSGRHAQFLRQPSEYLQGHFDIYIEDLKSTNGTKVNDSLVRKQLLKHGDTILVGKHSFIFDSGDAVTHERTAIYIPES
ncbi:MAG: FHA domain-containing protein [Gammaproteobacteria bacterium]|nr:FHA domain-containing protein [Gammaproteobacteria bacterium]